MTWHIAWSWQAEERVATIAAVEGGVLGECRPPVGASRG